MNFDLTRKQKENTGDTRLNKYELDDIGEK